jgi:membrane-bound serine protease (ClpP class)
LRRLVIGLSVTVAVLTLVGSAVSAKPDQKVARVDVLQVSGLFDPILVNAIESAIDRAEASGSQALILQVDSEGTLVSDKEIAGLIDRVATAKVPIAIWVGPPGARFYGSAAQLLSAADVTGMAPGARVGYIGVPLNPASTKIDFGIAEERLRNGSVGLSDARTLKVFKQRVSDEGIPTIASMLKAIDGYEENGVVVSTTKLEVLPDGSTRFDTIATVRFFKLNLVDQLFHTVASPPVTYLLLLTGLSLIVFEFFTAGVGIAGTVGAVCLVLACSGAAVLPTRPWAFAAIVLSMFAFAVDVQVGIPRFWTGVGIVLVGVASVFLFEPLPGTSLRPGWLALITGIGGITLTFVVGMPSMVRTRFATPTIGREWMIGRTGRAVGEISPEGIVEVDTAKWRARTNRATPISDGDTVRVAAIDGVTLEIEPMEGAARDYRERRTHTELGTTDE